MGYEQYASREKEEEVFSTFDEAVDYKVDEGWKSQRRGSEWEDVCPECQEMRVNNGKIKDRVD